MRTRTIDCEWMFYTPEPSLKAQQIDRAIKAPRNSHWPIKKGPKAPRPNVRMQADPNESWKETQNGHVIYMRAEPGKIKATCGDYLAYEGPTVGGVTADMSMELARLPSAKTCPDWQAQRRQYD